jgi:hypothetical protein
VRAQDYEFIRHQLFTATADLSGSTKGQLQAWLEDAQYTTDTFKRKKPTYIDEVTGVLVTPDNPPIPGKQTRAKGSHIPLVLPIEYATASWRRAVLALEPNESAWLLWCYGDATRYAYQVEIVRWGWEAFTAGLEGKRIAAKTLDRMRALVWLAAQDVKRELRGGESCYQACELARLSGVSKYNWSRNYSAYFDYLRNIFLELDMGALAGANAKRREQKNIEKTLTCCKS